MTVINAMRFNKTSGGMVADSQGSTDLRKYDLFDKAALLDGRIIFGGTGSSGVLEEAKAKLTKAYSKEHTTEQHAHKLTAILNETYRAFIDKEMQTRFGFGVGEFTAGRLVDGTPIGSHLMPTAMELYEGRDKSAQDLRNNAFVVIGKDSDDCHIYFVPMAGQPGLWPMQYATFGSGRDESDSVLHRFLKSVPRKERQEIDFVRGMAALIRATNRSGEINPGVGGVPTIAYFIQDGSKVLPEEDSLLATEIIRVADGELVSQEKAMQELESLLMGKDNCKAIEERIFYGNENHREIMRLLRGYRNQKEKW